MKTTLVALLASVSLAAGAAQPRQPKGPSTPDECGRLRPGEAGFTQDKRICYEGLAALGRYQELLDRIEGQPLGLAAQEKFFLGAAYFGLSNRTGAHSLQCFYTVHSRQLLEEFLAAQQDLFRTQHDLGSSEDMKYADQATKTLEAMKDTLGCEESAPTLASLGRRGRSETIERLQGLFYKTDKPDPLRQDVDAKLDELAGAMRRFVSEASKLETRSHLNLTQIDSGRQYLQTLQGLINDGFKDPLKAPLVTVESRPVGNEGDSFPGFAYDKALLQQVLTDLDARTAHIKDLRDKEIAGIEKAILDAVHAESMEDYARRKEEKIAEVLRLSSQLVQPMDLWSRFEASDKPGLSSLQQELSRPSQDPLVQQLATLNTTWARDMKRLCDPRQPRWFCPKGGTP